MKLNTEDLEFAHDIIWSAMNYAEAEGFDPDYATDEAEATLREAGLSEEEIRYAFDTYEHC